MGVLECCRNECDNIMCKQMCFTRDNGSQYICDECVIEFTEAMKNAGYYEDVDYSSRKIMKQFTKFLQTTPGRFFVKKSPQQVDFMKITEVFWSIE